MNFIGREEELKQLQSLLKKKTASLVVVKGRRRIGKSRLIEEFGKSFDRVFTFSGIFPTPETTLKNQLDNFGWQLGKLTQELPFKEDDWNGHFLRLANYTRKGRVLILLDEISWMGSLDPNFLGKLKNAWDLEFKQNHELVLVLCGSVSTWINKNILSSTGYFGRISLTLTIKELPLSACNQFWGTQKHIAAHEKFKVLSITGGIPKYLEEIHPDLSAEQNIKSLCFKASGLLFNEFTYIFTDIFAKRESIYKNIILVLANGKYELKAIQKALHVPKGGTLSEYLDELVISGFIRRDHTWDLKTGKITKFSQYRISDNYLRFYLKYIAPNKTKIERDSFNKTSLVQLPNWEGIMGLQFENLVLNNRQKILELLDIMPQDVVYDNPFFQHKNTRQAGCQIDYLIQTRFNTLYICEIKFAKNPLTPQIITEVKTKIKNIKVPRYMSFRPVLIHVNGATDAVLDSEYFAHIIDFSDLLKN